MRTLLLLVALSVTAALSVLLAPQRQSSADPGTSQQVAQGKKLFAVGCGSCHGLSGEGQVTSTIEGPPLVGVGAAAVEFQVATGRMPLAYPEAQAPKHPVVYDQNEIAALAAYVATLGPGPAIPAPDEYSMAGVTQEDTARGGELYRTNCSACHNAEGVGGALGGGKYAPSLLGTSNLHIYEAMVTGPQQMPVFNNNVMRPADKRAIIAYLNDLHSRPDPGGLDLGWLGPVSEGLWAWIVGMGTLVLFAIWIGAKGAKAK